MTFFFFFFFFEVAPSVARNAAITKTVLANGVIIFFINGKLTFINGARILPKNPSSWLTTFLVVPFDKIPLFSKDLLLL